MSGRPKDSEKLERLNEILRRMPRNYLKTVKDFHEELSSIGLEASVRAVQRDLEDLRDQFDIHCDMRGNAYGYKWAKNAKSLSMSDLTLQESLMLRLSEEYLKDLLPPNLIRSMKGFFEFSRSRLFDPSNGSPTLEKQWLDKVQIISERQPLIPPDIDSDVFETITDALYKNRYLKLNYENAQGKKTKIRVKPLGLVQQGVRFYIACRYENGEDYSLAVHRINDAEMSTMSFEVPDDFDLKEYVQKGRFSFGDGRMVEVAFTVDRFAGIHLAETPLSKDQEITDVDEAKICIKATVVDSLLLDKFVYSFGKSLYSYDKKFIESDSN